MKAQYQNLNTFAAMMRPGGLGASRPFVNSKGQACYVATVNGKNVVMAANDALLRYDEWKDIDRTVLQVGTDRLTAIADLQSKGLTHPLGSLGVTLSQWQTASDMTPAVIDMSGITPGPNSKVAFDTVNVPVPIIHKDFFLNIRHLEASRRGGEGLDVTQSTIAARLVAEASEDMLFSGSPIRVEGGVIYGYLNFPGRNTVTMATPWDQVTQANNDLLLGEISDATAALRADHFYGPYTIYIPAEYEGKLDEDYREAGDQRTLRQRIMALSGIAEIKVADRLTGDNVVVVQLTREVVDLAVAQGISTIQWNVMGGMQQHFKVMACWVPRLKADYEGNSGIVHIRPGS